MHIGSAMIRKRIEIVSRMLMVGVMLCAAPGAVLAGEHGAQAFPVFVESYSRPLPLPPLPGVRAQNGLRPADIVPDIPYAYFWTPRDGLRLRAREYARRQPVSEHSPGILGGFEQVQVDTPDTRWRPRPSRGGWNAGAARWNTQLDDGVRVAFGSSDIGSSAWNDILQLGGISLSQRFLADSDDVAQWNYSMAFGVVDQSASGASDLQFGPTAGSVALNYEYRSGLGLETRAETVDDLFMSAVTGRYDLGLLGRWQSGVARSNQGVQQGWRYRARADFDLADDMRLAWTGERQTDGFMDIRRYAAGSSPVGSDRQRWSASWDTGDWGEWSGSFERVDTREGAQQRRFGLSQQFWYSPNLRVGIHAEREVLSDDYDIGLRFSFPLY